MSLWDASGDPQITSLKQKIGSLESQLANQANVQLSLNLELNELRQGRKEDLHKLQEESARAVKAEGLLSKRTEELKLCQTQKANSQQAYLSLEAKLKDEQEETKRLNYQLEVITSSGSNSNNSVTASRLAEDKVILERKVQQLTSDLGKVQLELEHQKENAGGSSGGDTRSNDKANGLENENASLKAEITLLKSKTSRQSISGPAERGNFGFNSSGSTNGARQSLIPSNRPSSSLGNHKSAIPSSTSRRDSSFSIPSSSSIQKLESELDDYKHKIETLEKDLSSLKTKLSIREKESLTLENKLMALERISIENERKFRNELDEKVEEIEEGRREVGRVRETLRGELDRVVKGSRDAEINSKGLIERLRAEVEKKDGEVERAEEAKDEIEREMIGRKEAEASLKKALEEARGTNRDLEMQVEDLRKRIESSSVSGGKEVEALEEDLAKTRDQLLELEATTSTTIDRLQSRIVDLEQSVEASRTELLNAPKAMTDEEKSKLEAEFEVIHTSLEKELEESMRRLEDEIFKNRELEQREVVPKPDLDALKERLTKSEKAVEEASTEIARLEGVRATLEEQLAVVSLSVETDLVATKQAIITKDAELEALHLRLADKDGELVLAFTSMEESRAQNDVEKKVSVDSIAAVTQERASLASTLASNRLELLAFEATVAELEQAKSTLQAARKQQEQAFQELRTSHQAELDVCDEALQAAQARIEELEKSLEGFSSVNQRSTAEELRASSVAAQLEEANALVASLQSRIEELESLEWRAIEAKKGVEDQVARLVKDVEELQTEIDDLRSANGATQKDGQATADVLRADLEDTKQLLETAEARIEDVEGRLATATAALEEAKKSRDELEIKVQGLELVGTQLVEHRSTITDLTRELDSTRSDAEDATMVHLREVSELQLRIQELEVQQDQSHGKDQDFKRTRAELQLAESRIEELLTEIAHLEKSQRVAQEGSLDRRNSSTARAENAEKEVHRLRSELDRVTRQLIDAQDEMLVTSSSSVTGDRDAHPNADNIDRRGSHASRSFSIFSESDAAILVTRLREERDSLRTNLDFARNEQHFRVEALQERVHEAEQAKASEVARLEVALLEKSVELENQVNASRIRAEEVKAARERTLMLEQELDAAEKALTEARAEVGRAGGLKNRDESEAALVKVEHELKIAIDGSSKLRKIAVALQTKVEELEGRVTRRNRTIALHEQTIASLRTQIEPDDEGETKELEAPPSLSSAADMQLESRIGDLVKERDGLQAEVTLLARQIEDAQTEFNSATREANAENEALQKQLQTTISGLRAALDSAHTDMTELASRMGTADQQLAEAKDALASSMTSLSHVQAQLVDELSRSRRLEHHIAELEDELERTQAELTTMELENDAELEEQTAQIEQVETDKNQLVSELVSARHELTTLRAQLVSAARDGDQLRLIESELEATRADLERAFVDRDTRAQALIDAQQLADSERSRTEADIEAAKREIKTLRQLGRSSDEEVKNLRNHLARVQHDSQSQLSELDRLRTQLHQVKRDSQDQLREVIDSLQMHEKSAADQIGALEVRNRDLERALEVASTSPGMSAESKKQIEELERQVEAKTIEAEELDEKVMDVLRDQKRHISQIERLKGKIESLTRDLKLARAPSITAPAIITIAASAQELPAPPTQSHLPPSSAGKKRRAPAEFDPSSIINAPRGIIAPLTRTPSQTDKENNASATRKILAPVHLSAAKDGLVPLKPAALSPAAPRREALRAVEINDFSSINSASLPFSAKSVAPPASSFESLKARVQGMGGARV